MSIINVGSYAIGQWIAAAQDDNAAARTVNSAVTGEPVAVVGNTCLDTAAMLDHARTDGGIALRAMSFHQRAACLKSLAKYLDANKQELYALSHCSGATLADARIDVDGGISTVFVFASKARREMPDAHVLADGETEQLSRQGSFLGQHFCVPKAGVAIQINAFNFPVWGMLEKLAPAILGGMPVIVKPATSTAYVAEACFRMMLDSGALPDGALQLITGRSGELLDQLHCQDVVSFTGSANTALQLRCNPHLLRQSVTFTAEQDSLNACVLGPDATTDTPEFQLLVKEIVQEMTAKVGQKCTAIRRVMVPQAHVHQVIDAVSEKLACIRIGDPALAATDMGALVSRQQRRDVLNSIDLLLSESIQVFGQDLSQLDDVDADKGAFMTPTLLYCKDPDTANKLHQVEAFGPAATIMPYRNLDHASELLNRGGGSLVASVITNDTNVARKLVLGSAAFHGRIYINNRTCMQESTGHGSPLPHLVHGGPGRAGGGEELGGIRAVKHYMQRTAIQGSADMLSAIGSTWIPGATQLPTETHPFKLNFNELAVGQTIMTASRTVSLEDIEQFAKFTGDTFYAHMDEAAAAANPFFNGRVAHGYLLLSFAAGLFVDPDPGPVLANTGLTGLKFQKPVSPGDSIQVALTVKRKTPRNDTYGEVRWHVAITDQNGDGVATYELHTMNAF